jgi:prepilin-type N-terminal cleavage/methylation domain-containing protein
MLTEIKKNEKGFTLVELIVVIAIMAVLAALLIPRIMGNVEDARHQKEVTTAQTIASEITIWNAKAATDNDPLTVEVPAGVVATLPGGLTALPTGTTFPLATDVTINVDADGNASITEIAQ